MMAMRRRTSRQASRARALQARVSRTIGGSTIIVSSVRRGLRAPMVTRMNDSRNTLRAAPTIDHVTNSCSTLTSPVIRLIRRPTL